MQKIQWCLTTILAFLTIACSEKPQEVFVLVEGGEFVNRHSNLYQKDIRLTDFYISRYEVTQKEWMEIMNNNPSQFRGDNLPVESVTWYECVLYCNKRSLLEGLDPCYDIDSLLSDTLNLNDLDSLKWTVTFIPGANGYRLPSEAEWEYAASGGQRSRHYTYSGSDNIDRVAWYWKNSGDNRLEGEWHWIAIQNNNNRTHPIGSLQPNELGLYDMSGNVREWCADWYVDIQTGPGYVRSQRGGGWMGSAYRCEIATRHHFEASGIGSDQGFRLCRSVVDSRQDDTGI